MIEADKPAVRPRLAKREPTSFMTRHDIVIPAGTVLRADASRPLEDVFSAPIGLVPPGGEILGVFSVVVKPGAEYSRDALRKVIVS